MTKAVVLGANYYIGLSIIRALGAEGIPVVAVDYDEAYAYAMTSKYISEKLIAPHYLKEEARFLEYLIAYGKKQKEKPVLYPSADPYVSFVDRYFHILEAYFALPKMKQGLYSKVMDKESLAELARDYHIQTPPTVSPKEEDFLTRCQRDIGYPCLVKPTDSPKFVAVFRQKLFVAENETQLIDYIKQANGASCEVVIQKRVNGFDDHMYTYDAYLNQDSKVTHYTTCQKHRQYPINYGASVYTEQKHVPELHALGAPFLEGIGWKGFAEIEFKKDAHSGDYYMIEVNVRTTNLNVLLLKSGINMPLLLYKELTGHPVKPYAVTHHTGIRFRYTFDDWFAIRDYIKAKQLSLWHVLSSLAFKRKAYAIWDIKDPLPFFSFIKQRMFKHAVSKYIVNKESK